MERKIEKVLFIGNSHTFYNDMPYILKYFSVFKNHTPLLDPIMIAHGGKSLGEHKLEPEIRFNILYGNFKYVVLQQVAHPFGGKAELIRDSIEINSYIKSTDALAVAYMTWSEKNKLYNQQEMIDSYIEMANTIEAILCPVGIVWQKFSRKYPETEIYSSDCGHANTIGSYLVACVFYCTLLHENPIGLPSKIVHNHSLVFEIQDDIALNIQKVVWDEFKSKSI